MGPHREARVDGGRVDRIAGQHARVEMRGQGVASQRPVRAVVGAAKHAAVGRDHDRVVHDRERVRDDRALRHRLSDGPPAPTLIVAAVHLIRHHRPQTVGVGRIEGQRIDAACRQPFATKLPAESRIRARPGSPAGDRIHVVGALARRHRDAGVGRFQPAADRHPGLAPVVAAIETSPAREIHAPAHRARRQRARRHRAGRRSQPSPAVAVADEECRAARDERAPAIDVERRRECGSGEDVGRHRHPVASAVSRAGEADVRRQQQVMLVHRTDGKGQRAAHEASGIDLQPRGAGIAACGTGRPSALAS